MKFSIEKALEILSATPATLQSYLGSLSDDWLRQNEGAETWSPYDIVGHLIHGERTDWVERTKIVLGDSDKKTFEPFDRFAQFQEDQTRSIGELLREFAALRRQNLEEIRKLDISKNDLQKTGMHPGLGEVTLEQLLSTWVVHDLGHIYQISRVMASQYKSEVGPWTEYLRVLNE